jgi:hypothetical protein
MLLFDKYHHTLSILAKSPRAFHEPQFTIIRSQIMNRLTGKYALITGALQGLGLHMAI